MIPIVDSISNGVSVLPVAASIAQAGSVQRGGFASTFAAARGFSTEAKTAAGEGEVPAAPTAKSADAAMSLGMGSAASANPQVRKSLNRDVVAASAVAATNAAAEFIPAAATPIVLPLQTSLPPTVTTAARGGSAEALIGTFQSGSTQSGSTESGSSQSGMQMPAYEVATQKASFSYSASNGAAGIFAAAASPATSSAPSSGGTAGIVQSSFFSLEAGSVASAPPQTVGESQGSGSQHGAESGEPTELAESTSSFVLAATTQSRTSSKIVSQVTGNPWNGIQADGFGPESAEAIQQANEGAGGAVSVPILLANADLEAGAEAGVQAAFADKVNIGKSNFANAAGVVQDAVQDTVVQSGAQPGMGNPLAAIFGGQAAPSTVLNPAAPAESARAGLQLAAAKVMSAITGTGVRAGAGTRSSTPAAVVAAGPSMESSIGNQTPFSVFFSSPGPGTESAASALPKLILPPNSSAMRDVHGSGANSSSASPQSSGLPGGISPNGASPNAAGSSTKDSLNGSANENLQTAQGSRRDAEGNAASAQLAVAQTGAAPVAAPPPPSSAAATLPLGGPAAPVSDSLPKAEPSPAPAAPAGSVPAAAEALPTAVPGPVQVAQMMNRIGQSEMRIGMNTSAFGSVEVRTVVHANDVGLVIGSEKGDLRALLASDMPAIANTLQQQNLRLNSVNFMQGFAFSNNASGGGDSRQQSFVPTRASTSAVQSEATVSDSVEVSAAGEFTGGGLSILA